MSDAEPGQAPPPGPDAAASRNGAEELAQLREILSGPERRELEALRAQLADPLRQAERVGQVLPQAVVLSAGQGEQLAQALAPAVEATLHESVRRNSAVLVEAIFPVMGPAIRKAIAEALAKLVQAISRSLENTFTLQGLRWRLEAMRTGRSFAEVVLYHTLVYRVEQLFLIHRGAGLLLQHLQLPNIEVRDSDMVSGMLTAIQDFVRDSFRIEQGDQLQTMQVGDLNVWVESAPHAILAAAIRGHAPVELREAMQEALERIHRELGAQLQAFAGDARPFALARVHLEPCLREQFGASQRPRRFPWKVAVAAVLVVGALVAWGWRGWSRERTWRDYVERVRALEGVVVTEAYQRDGVYHLRGLRDPLAIDPAKLLPATGLDPSAVVSRWEPYHALAERFVFRRAVDVLRPPATVQLRLAHGVLTAEGTAGPGWMRSARERAPLIAGIDRLDTSGLRDESGDRMSAHRREVEGTVLTFADGTQLVPGQEPRIAQLVAHLNELRQAAAQAGAELRLNVVGHTDRTGTEQYNARLSLERAETVHRLLVREGLGPMPVEVEGVGPREPLRPGMSESEELQNRRVAFRVELEHRAAARP